MYNNAPQAGLASLVNSPYRDMDVMRVQMTPREVAGLQQIALSYGAREEDLYDPVTGQPKFSFLKKLLPTIIGAILPGVPGLGKFAETIGFGSQALGTAFLVGGATSLIEGDLKKGLMAGLGAYSGANLAQSLQQASMATDVPRVSAEEVAKTNRAIDAAKATVGAGPVDSSKVMGALPDFQAGVVPTVTPPPPAPITAPPSPDGLDFFKSANAFKGTPTAQDLIAGRVANAANTGIAGILGGAQKLFTSPQSRQVFGEALGGGFKSPFAQNLSRQATFMGLVDAFTPEYEIPEGEEEGASLYVPGDFNPMYGYGREHSYFLPGQYYKKTKKGLVPYTPYATASGYAAGGPVQAPDINQQRAIPHQNAPYPFPNQNYPLSTVVQANYQSNAPQSREVVSGYEAKIDPFTGEEKFAEGGQVGGLIPDEDDIFALRQRMSPAFSPEREQILPAQNPFAEGFNASDPAQLAALNYQQQRFSNTLDIMNMNPGMSYNKALELINRSQPNQPQMIDKSANFDWGADLAYDPSVYGRQFNWQKYIAENPDLAAAGIDTPFEAATHYSNYGKNENRAGVEFLNPYYGQPEVDPLSLSREERLARLEEMRESGQLPAQPTAGLPAVATPPPPPAGQVPPPTPKPPAGLPAVAPKPTPTPTPANRIRNPYYSPRSGVVTSDYRFTDKEYVTPEELSSYERESRSPVSVPPIAAPPSPFADQRQRYVDMINAPPRAPVSTQPMMDYLADLNRRARSPQFMVYPPGGSTGGYQDPNRPPPDKPDPDCPAGYTYDRAAGACVPIKDVTNPPNKPTPPKGPPGTTITPPAPPPPPPKKDEPKKDEPKKDEPKTGDEDDEKTLIEKLTDFGQQTLINMGLSSINPYLGLAYSAYRMFPKKTQDRIKKFFGLKVTDADGNPIPDLTEEEKAEEKAKLEAEIKAAVDAQNAANNPQPPPSGGNRGGVGLPGGGPGGGRPIGGGPIAGGGGRRGYVGTNPGYIDNGDGTYSDAEGNIYDEDGNLIEEARIAARTGGRIRAMQAGGMAMPPPNNPYGAAVGEDYNFGFSGGGAMPTEYLAGGKLLEGEGDGMSDDIPAVIRGKGIQRAALADGEFVVPADVVSHLGNGSTNAGAKKLYTMMDRIREARTGRTRQSPAVNSNKYLPA